MKKIFLILLFIPLSIVLFGQDLEYKDDYEEEDEVEEPMVPVLSVGGESIVLKKKPMVYPKVRQEDKLDSKKLLRMIDCRDRMNFPLYYPTITMENRESLIQTLVRGITQGRVQAYSSEKLKVSERMTLEEVMNQFDAGNKVLHQEKLDGTGDTTIIMEGAINWGEVREFLIQEEWFFDKKRSVMDVRILAICPIRVYNKTLNVSGDEDYHGEEVRKKMFWVYFEEARRVLANTVCFVGENEAANITYDDLFHKRRFASYIMAKSDPMNDRQISDYVRNDFEAMLESERIKNQLIKDENDFWEY